MPGKCDPHQRDWEELAEFNPEWAVLTTAESKRDGWDLDEFFRTGAAKIDSLWQVGGQHGVPAQRRAALDFGCGVGRLSRPLASRFERCVGVDISTGMIERAEKLHESIPNLSFQLNEQDDLRRFEDAEFDAVVSFLVLQHIPSGATVRSFISEFTRILAPGGLISFQLLSHIPIVYRLRIRRRLYRIVRALGVSVERAHRMGLQSMLVRSLPEEEVISLLQSGGCRVLHTDTDPAGNGVLSTTYYATK